MSIELRRLPLATETDILIVHDFAMHLGRHARLSPGEQVNFAARVAQLASQVYQQGDQITFSIVESKQHQYFLKAVLTRSSGCVQTEVPHKISDNVLIDMYDVNHKTREQLENAYHDMQQFSYALSHELKNSLANLKLAVSLAEQEELPEAINNYMQIIDRATARLEATMNSLNQLIRMEHSFPQVIKLVSPGAVFEEIRDEFEEQLYTINATLSANFTAAENFVYVEAYLRSIFRNVISNAIKYADPGRPLHLLVTGKMDKEHFVFSVTDNGQGMDLEMVGKKLFMPFTRFSNRVEGSGLGLYLVRNMTERNGGRIEVESQPGVGSTFRFFLKEY